MPIEDDSPSLLAPTARSIDLRVIPVGVFLSGGIDSGTIAALMAVQSAETDKWTWEGPVPE